MLRGLLQESPLDQGLLIPNTLDRHKSDDRVWHRVQHHRAWETTALRQEPMVEDFQVIQMVLEDSPRRELPRQNLYSLPLDKGNHICPFTQVRPNTPGLLLLQPDRQGKSMAEEHRLHLRPRGCLLCQALVDLLMRQDWEREQSVQRMPGERKDYL